MLFCQNAAVEDLLNCSANSSSAAVLRQSQIALGIISLVLLIRLMVLEF